mmetsp:Transcript_25600/g.64268  ORF Transcript_25600/g.64268 Transcript_25600/m.64268 type:complete len:212 (+) Transcript_25600:4300-4935(+)
MSSISSLGISLEREGRETYEGGRSDREGAGTAFEREKGAPEHFRQEDAFFERSAMRRSRGERNARSEWVWADKCASSRCTQKEGRGMLPSVSLFPREEGFRHREFWDCCKRTSKVFCWTSLFHVGKEGDVKVATRRSTQSSTRSAWSCSSKELKRTARRRKTSSRIVGSGMSPNSNHAPTCVGPMVRAWIKSRSSLRCCSSLDVGPLQRTI